MKKEVGSIIHSRLTSGEKSPVVIERQGARVSNSDRKFGEQKILQCCRSNHDCPIGIVVMPKHNLLHGRRYPGCNYIRKPKLSNTGQNRTERGYDDDDDDDDDDDNDGDDYDDDDDDKQTRRKICMT
jgi:hypothetical protein